VSNLSFGSGGHLHFVLQRLTCPRQHPYGSGPRETHGSGIRPVMHRRPPGGMATSPAVSCCLSATSICFLGILFPPDGIGPSSRSAYPLTAVGTRRGYHVPHAQESTGVGALFIPGRWCSPGWTPFTSRHPPPSLAASPVPRYIIPPGGNRANETSPRVYVLHPSGLPLACSPRVERGPLGFTLGFGPRGYPRRPPGQGRALSTGSELHLRHRPNLQSDEFTCAVRPRVAQGACGVAARGRCAPPLICEPRRPLGQSVRAGRGPARQGCAAPPNLARAGGCR